MKKVLFSVEYKIQDLTFLKYFGLDPELVLPDLANKNVSPNSI